MSKLYVLRLSIALHTNQGRRIDCLVHHLCTAAWMEPRRTLEQYAPSSAV